ncbi:MAG: KpsF/GutQ family sugar-phosphate isomerase [Pseudomonadota bacterium]|nr:KpsF/GutQ family sugar-phosphate isomerase [Pseudomonadota bacterium]
MSHSTPSLYLASAHATLKTEQHALDVLMAELDQRFDQACALILACTGRVVITGMGKSGHIGRKMAATFASTGTPSFFMHPGEAAHGDLGMLVRGDVLIAISNSGQSDEIMMLTPVVQRNQIPLITISRDTCGPLPQLATVALTLGKSKEACPLGLAPTSSTTATLALGDALAVALLQVRGFTKDDFALSHPAGALGRRLLTRLEHLMHSGDELPIVTHQTSIRDALIEMTDKRLGMTAVVDEHLKLIGLFTDGDLRRSLEEQIDLSTPVAAVMTANPVTMPPHTQAFDALTQMKAEKINHLLVVNDEGDLVGALNMHDFLKAGVS